MKDYTQYFTQKTRTNGENYICLVECPPSELELFIYDVHTRFNAMPNDWIYRIIDQAFDELKNNHIDDLSIEGDTYFSEMIDWLHNGFAKEYCDEALRVSNEKYFINIIILAQYLAMREIYDLVNEFLEDHKNDDKE